MSTFYLLNTVQTGTKTFYPGTLIDDVQTDTASITGVGGVLWPSSDAIVAAAAAICQKKRSQGQAGPYLDDIMSAAADASQLAAAGGTPGAIDGSKLAAGSVAVAKLAATISPIRKRTISMSLAEIQAAGATTTLTKADPLGALPAGSCLAGFSIDAMTGVDDATHANFNLELGVAGANDVMASTAVKAGSTAAPKVGTAAALGFNGAPAVGTPSMKLTGAVNLSTCTAGALTVSFYYFVAPTAS